MNEVRMDFVNVLGSLRKNEVENIIEKEKYD